MHRFVLQLTICSIRHSIKDAIVVIELGWLELDQHMHQRCVHATYSIPGIFVQFNVLRYLDPNSNRAHMCVPPSHACALPESGGGSMLVDSIAELQNPRAY